MPTIRFDLNEEYKAKLEDAANEMHMKLQDYIRYKLFELKTIFTADEAVKRIQNGEFDVLTTQVPKAISGRGLASQLMKACASFVKEKGLKFKKDQSCSYAQSWLERH